MEDTEFCYCCRVHHPREQMRQVKTALGLRWRCIRSIEAAQCSQETRDDFGRRQTEINKEASRQMAAHSLRVRDDHG